MKTDLKILEEQQSIYLSRVSIFTYFVGLTCSQCAYLLTLKYSYECKECSAKFCSNCLVKSNNLNCVNCHKSLINISDELQKRLNDIQIVCLDCEKFFNYKDLKAHETKHSMDDSYDKVLEEMQDLTDKLSNMKSNFNNTINSKTIKQKVTSKQNKITTEIDLKFNELTKELESITNYRKKTEHFENYMNSYKKEKKLLDLNNFQKQSYTFCHTSNTLTVLLLTNEADNFYDDNLIVSGCCSGSLTFYSYPQHRLLFPLCVQTKAITSIKYMGKFKPGYFASASEDNAGAPPRAGRRRPARRASGRPPSARQRLGHGVARDRRRPVPTHPQGVPRVSTTLNPLIQALFSALAPILFVIVLHLAIRAMMPMAVKLLGQKIALALQERVDKMAQPAIAYAVATGSAEIGRMGPMTVESRNLMVGLAVRYFVDHAPELAAQAGEYVQGSEGQIDEKAGLLFQKLLARFDAHPAVQGLIGNVPPGDVPATVGG